MSTQNPIPPFELNTEIQEHWEEINEAIQRVLRHGQFIMGEEVREFEKKAAEFLGVKYAVGVNSGTDALVIGLRAAGVGAGDEVITTPFSFFATAESISILGAKPVFVDIEERSFNIDPDKIEAAVSEKTKAIMPVHLYGNPCRMESIFKVAQKHDLKIIEDCAQSFGATDLTSGKKTGAIGDVGAFSFFPTKNLGAYGDGGLIATNSEKIVEEAGMLRTHGSKKKYQNEILGYNSRLDTIQAAVLLVKIQYINRFNQRRREIAELYWEGLKDIEALEPPEVVDGHVFHQYTIKVKDGQREALRAYLKEQGIGSMVYYPVPQDKLPVYEGQYEELPVSSKLAEQVLSLPIWPQMKDEQVKRVIQAIQQKMS